MLQRHMKAAQTVSCTKTACERGILYKNKAVPTKKEGYWKINLKKKRKIENCFEFERRHDSSE